MIACVDNIPEAEQPISERYRQTAKQWADAESAAHILEECKTTELEKRKTALIDKDGPMSEAKAERLVKSSKEWEGYINGMCLARGAANLLKTELEVLRMQHKEWIGQNADERQERRLGEMHP